MNSAAINNFIAQHRKNPVIIVGTIKNESDEHIPTVILTQKFESALVNSGKASFVANAVDREEILKELEASQDWASDATVKRLANITGADFMLMGSVHTIVDAISGKMTRTYYVHVELVDIESTVKLWIGDNAEIKKVITRPSTRF
jgi:hypothetical protein